MGNCSGCAYWRPLTNVRGSMEACHYMLDTGKRRELDGEVCKSRSETRERHSEPFEVPWSQR